MKKSVLTFLIVCIAVISLHAFRSFQTSGIKGMVVPADAIVTYVWAINGIDSIKKILPEFLFINHFMERHVGCAKEAEVDGNFFCRSHALYLAMLQHR